MVTLQQLLFPILLSAVLVFVMSSLIHMVLKWHNTDYRKFSNEDAVRAAISGGSASPGQYVLPWAQSMEECKTPEFEKKMLEGPIAMVWIKRPGPMKMGPQLGQWFVFNLLVSVFVAYLASRTLPAGTDYLRVFQVVGTVGFMTYGLGEIPMSIWMGKPWIVAAKEAADGLLYGLMMGGAFGWLWPR